MTTEAFINPALLRWARERDRKSLAAAAEGFNVSPDRLESWESGDTRPTFRQAQNLAKKFGIPFGYLYLQAPPEESLPLPDLRTLADQPPLPPTPEFSALLNDVLAQHEWYRAELVAEEADPLPFVGSFTTSDQALVIANAIKSTFSIDNDLRATATGWDDFLRTLVRQVEEQGVLVMRSGVVGNNNNRKLSVDEFRGFAISDDLAPLVFINGQDAKSAQIFTLAHEVAHLFIGQSGVSKPNYREKSSEQGNQVERLSNRIAAEVLCPRDDFLQHWRDDVALDANLGSLASRYRVSRFVVLRQAYDLDLVGAETYRARYDALLSQVAHGSESSGGNFYATLMVRNSATLTTRVVTAVANGRLAYREAARLLNVKTGTLANVANHVIGGAPSG